MAERLTNPETHNRLRCSARVVTTAATFVAAVGTVVMGISQGSSASQGRESLAPAVLAGVGVPLITAIAWFASRLRYGAVMVACAVVGLVPWTEDWWKGDGTHVGGYGFGLATVGVLLTSFVSANSKPALREAWEQCAPASAAAAGWLVSLTLLLTAFVDNWRWFGPLPLSVGAMLFLGLSLISASAAKQRMSRGAAPSAYMDGRSVGSVLLSKFFGGAAYVLVAVAIIIPTASFIWLMTGGNVYQRGATESFSDDGTKRMPAQEK